LGPSSISTLPQGYSQSFPEAGAWSASVNAGVLPCKRGHALTQDDRARRRLIEQIMCDFSGDLRLLGGRDACGAEIEALQPLIAEGIAQLDGEFVTVPAEARPFCRLVARAFDAYISAPAARHSRAV
jgi:oxygen-independent coproporphyrinogen-3 oxidase